MTPERAREYAERTHRVYKSVTVRSEDPNNRTEYTIEYAFYKEEEGDEHVVYPNTVGKLIHLFKQADGKYISKYYPPVQKPTSDAIQEKQIEEAEGRNPWYTGSEDGDEYFRQAMEKDD